MKLYDKKRERLIEIKKGATAEFWEKHWQTKDGGKASWLVRKITKRFIRPSGRVLDAGCGDGRNVRGFEQWGFEGYGVDFAVETIERVKKIFPKLRLSCQDVRELDFPSEYFDGYWSLGVIEHFWEGYDEILKEAGRVLRKDGYLFVTFPWISPLRWLRIYVGIYLLYSSIYSTDFYQFILTQGSVVKNAEKCGFKLVKSEGYDAIKGIKDEVSVLRPFLQKMYDRKDVFSRSIRYALSFLLKGVAGHMRLCVFRKI